MKETDKIYIAGHNGMVGAALIKALKIKGFNNLVYLTSKELDLRIFIRQPADSFKHSKCGI